MYPVGVPRLCQPWGSTADTAVAHRRSFKLTHYPAGAELDSGRENPRTDKGSGDGMPRVGGQLGPLVRGTLMVVIEDRPLDCVEARVRARWHFLLDYLCLSPAGRRQKEAAFVELAVHYRHPDRYYHTLHHLADLIDIILKSWPLPSNLDALGLAVFYHDVIHDTAATDNEERSAAFAEQSLEPLGVAPEIIAEVRRLVLLTKCHETAAEDGVGRLLLDADLAILGAGRIRYSAYARAVRQEYYWVPEEQYRAGRMEILQRFLGRERIYFSERLFRRREERARRNLRREIEELRI